MRALTTGPTAKNLYDHTGTFMVSRLTYGDLSIIAGEAYGRFDLNRGWFVKGYVGGGSFRKGDLKDEDFPLAINPYSATLSVQEDGMPIGVFLQGSIKLGPYALFSGN
jgi:hypothetical protein